MSYYKIICGNVLIDAVPSLQCCKYVERSRCVLRCSALKSPQGVIASRTGEFYHVEGWPKFPAEVGDICDVQIVEVDKAEYDASIIVLDAKAETETPIEDPFIVAPDASLECVKVAKKAALSKACNAAITAGFTVTFENGSAHTFDYTLEDQSNLANLTLLVLAGATECDYYDSKGNWLTLSPVDLSAINECAAAHKNYNIVYYHCLCNWIDSLGSILEVAGINYGDIIPQDFRNDYLRKYADAMNVPEYM